MTLNRLTVCLIVLRLLLLEGCIIPVGQDTIGKVIGDADLAFIELGVTTKSEVVERLGNDYLFLKSTISFIIGGTTRPDSFGLSPWVRLIGPGETRLTDRSMRSTSSSIPVIM